MQEERVVLFCFIVDFQQAVTRFFMLTSWYFLNVLPNEKINNKENKQENKINKET